MCLYEPIQGQYPSREFCEKHKTCENCRLWYIDEKEEFNPYKKEIKNLWRVK